MTTREDRRREAIGRIADHILAAGLEQTSLRTLAAAAGTSDRMLLYYFADKEDVLREALGALALRLGGLLDRAIPAGTLRRFDDLLAEVCAALQAPALQPFMLVWLELAARAARGEQPFRLVAGLMADGFLGWISDRLLVGREDERRHQAALLLATVDGLALLAAVGRTDTVRLVLGGPGTRMASGPERS